MLLTIFTLLSLGLTVTCLNFIPLFMPPTWMVIAFFYIQFNLPLIPTVIIGAASATLGRSILAYSSKRYLKPYLSVEKQLELESLGKLIETKKVIALPLLMIFYAFSPIPSNQFFIAAGLVDADMKLIRTSFFLGRLFSYSFWATLANRTVDNLDLIFVEHLKNPRTYLIELISFVVIYLIGNYLMKLALRYNHKHAS